MAKTDYKMMKDGEQIGTAHRNNAGKITLIFWPGSIWGYYDMKFFLQDKNIRLVRLKNGE